MFNFSILKLIRSWNEGMSCVWTQRVNLSLSNHKMGMGRKKSPTNVCKELCLLMTSYILGYVVRTLYTYVNYSLHQSMVVTKTIRKRKTPFMLFLTDWTNE